jgi:hypothetical protein
MKKLFLVLCLSLASPTLVFAGCCSFHSGVCGCGSGRDICCDGSFSPSCTCSGGSDPSPRPTARPTAIPTHSSTGTHITGKLQDRGLTPGQTLPVSVRKICKKGYASSVRNVSLAEKMDVFAEYGIPYSDHAKYEVDHLISLELGGSNDISNLWPEPLASAKLKDKLENKLHSLVCAGKLSLRAAQRAIAGDWVAAYNRYVGN